MAGKSAHRLTKAHPVKLSLTGQEVETARSILSQIVNHRDPDLDLLYLAIVIRNSLNERRHFFGADLFGDPAWDVILSLYCAEGRGEQLSVTALGQSAGLPQSTVSRWLPELVRKGLVERFQDGADQRRVFLRLTRSGHDQASLWLRHVGSQLALIWPTP